MYTCEQCGYATEIKSNYTRHLNRKTTCVTVLLPVEKVQKKKPMALFRKGMFALTASLFILTTRSALSRRSDGSPPPACYSKNPFDSVGVGS